MARQPECGFTLMELLLVIMLVALSASMISLVSPESGSRLARYEGRQLQDLLQSLRHEAVLNFSDYGLRIEPASYSVMHLDEQGQWQPDQRFRLHNLPHLMRFRLELNEAGSSLGNHEVASGVPHILLLSSDEISAFTLWIEQDNKALLSLSSDGIEDAELELLN
ncbi:type II secretion system minor pseudopilin GspH [Ectopseudomonas mendocina]|uniref:Type II secretion system protein H n=1 Tax=Ectopseudomonas mendocina TaxID=300 RepID=A0ABZ2RF46_ECTME